MKTLVLSVLAFFTLAFVNAQNITKNVETQKDHIITKYYDNGVIYEQGTVNIDNKLHGTWTRYDLDGNILVQGTFNNGMKEGKWLFWDNQTLKEVDFSKNKLVKYTQWTKADYLAGH